MIKGQEELLKAFSEIVIEEHKDEFRAYYDDAGKVIYYLANDFPEGDNWIAIDHATYKTPIDWMYVIDGRLEKRLPTFEYRHQLKSNGETYRVVKAHAGLLLEDDEEYKDVEYYD